MEQLKYAIAMAGGVTALAKELGIAQNRVSNWLTRCAVPDGWLTVLSMRYPMAVKPNDTSSKGGRQRVRS